MPKDIFQFIAQKLLDINESQRFKDTALLSDNEKETQDAELFHRTRLVNCGYFMHIVLGGKFDPPVGNISILNHFW